MIGGGTHYIMNRALSAKIPGPRAGPTAIARAALTVFFAGKIMHGPKNSAQCQKYLAETGFGAES